MATTVDANTGAIKWKLKLGIEQRNASLVAADGKLYVPILDDPAIVAGVRDTGGRVSLAIFDCKKPVIGAINGVAITGGFEVALFGRCGGELGAVELHLDGLQRAQAVVQGAQHVLLLALQFRHVARQLLVLAAQAGHLGAQGLDLVGQLQEAAPRGRGRGTTAVQRSLATS